MRNTKIYFVVAKLEKKEQKKFLHFLQSPYYNSSKDLIVIYQMMINYLKGVRKTELSKEKIWKKIHPTKQYDDVRFRKHLSELFKLMEQFLALQAYEADIFQQQNNLIKSISEKKLDKIADQNTRKARDIYDKSPYIQSRFYFSKYQLESNIYKLKGYDIKRTVESNLPAVIQNLDYFYFTERLKLMNSLIERGLLTTSKDSQLYTQEIIQYIDSTNSTAIPSIAIYYKLYLMLVEPNNDQHYFELKDLLKEHYLKFSPSEAYEMFSRSINYAIRRSNKGDSQFQKELFLTYKELVNNKLLLTNKDGFRPAVFRNIIVTGLRLNEFTWVKDFIQDYQQYLPPESRENTVRYNLATLYFYQKKYTEVIDQLRNVEFEDLFYNLNSKSILLATYYETDEIEPLYSLFDSFTVFVKRQKKLSTARKALYLNLIKYTRRLTRLNPGDLKGLEKISDEVIANRNIASYKWLKDKIEEARINGVR